MTHIFLGDAARQIIEEIVALGLPESSAIIVTIDSKTDLFCARFIEKENLALLKTRYLGEAIPGIGVHLFGTDTLPENSQLEFNFLKARSEPGVSRLSPEINLSYFLRVSVHKMQHPVQAPQRDMLAS